MRFPRSGRRALIGATVLSLLVCGATAVGTSNAVADIIGVPPGPVTGPTFNVFYGDLSLAWTNPTDVDWTETVVCRTAGTTPATSPDTCASVWRGRESDGAVAGVPEPGATETYTFFALDVEGLVSAPTVLTIPGVTLTATARPSRVVWGKSFTITGALKDAITGAPLEQCLLDIVSVDPYTEESFDGGHLRTGADGKYTYTFGPGQNYVWYVLFAGDDTHNGYYSRDLPIPVSKAVYVDPLKKKDTLAHGVKLFIGADPLSPGTKVTVEQLVKGKWKQVATKKLSKKGYAQITMKPKARGTYTYRVYAAADRQSEGNTSRKVTVTLT